MQDQKKSIPLATALRAGLKGYSLSTLRADFGAGLIVSLVALPLSMALGIAVGLPPQHGLYTAIVAGVVAALCGGSSTQVSGPTAAFVVILAPIVAKFGLHGIIWCQILSGLMLIALGTARLGKLISYVPYPVTTGFTAGIAVTIATLSLNDFLGLGIGTLEGHYIDKAAMILSHLPAMQWQEVSVGLLTLLCIVFFPRISKKIPSPVVGIGLGTLLAWYFSSIGAPVDTLNTRFSYLTPEGTRMPGIPPYLPALHLPGDNDLYRIPSMAELSRLILPAFVIAALAGLESLLSATVADGLAKTKHDPNAELNGIGIANIFSGLAAGIPATGAIARTAANIHAGAKTPISSIIHALLILFYMAAFARYISYIPMAALAALLLMVAWRMSHAHQFITIMKMAPRSDVAVLLACFLLTVFIDMVAGVSIGMILSCLLFMKRVADYTHIDVSVPEIVGAVPEEVTIYRIEGPLFFGTVDKALEMTHHITDNTKKLIIDMTHVPIIDMTGMLGMKTFLNAVAHHGRRIVICGRDDVTSKIRQKIAKTPAAGAVTYAPSYAEALKNS